MDLRFGSTLKNTQIKKKSVLFLYAVKVKFYQVIFHSTTDYVIYVRGVGLGHCKVGLG